MITDIETSTVHCDPEVVRQYRIVGGGGTAENPNAMIRRATGMTHCRCNCGYSSPWFDERVHRLAVPRFFDKHRPPEWLYNQGDRGRA